jgi:hypothetical protein
MTEISFSSSSTGTPSHPPPSGSRWRSGRPPSSSSSRPASRGRGSGTPGGLLGGLAKRVRETGLKAEMTEYDGYERNDRPEARARDRAMAPERIWRSPTLAPVGSRCSRLRRHPLTPKLLRKRLHHHLRGRRDGLFDGEGSHDQGFRRTGRGIRHRCVPGDFAKITEQDRGDDRMDGTVPRARLSVVCIDAMAFS